MAFQSARGTAEWWWVQRRAGKIRLVFVRNACGISGLAGALKPFSCRTCWQRRCSARTPRAVARAAILGKARIIKCVPRSCMPRARRAAISRTASGNPDCMQSAAPPSLPSPCETGGRRGPRRRLARQLDGSSAPARVAPDSFFPGLLDKSTIPGVPRVVRTRVYCAASE